jgi:hypothetical protein
VDPSYGRPWECAHSFGQRTAKTPGRSWRSSIPARLNMTPNVRIPVIVNTQTGAS